MAFLWDGRPRNQCGCLWASRLVSSHVGRRRGGRSLSFRTFSMASLLGQWRFLQKEKIIIYDRCKGWAPPCNPHPYPCPPFLSSQSIATEPTQGRHPPWGFGCQLTHGFSMGWKTTESMRLSMGIATGVPPRWPPPRWEVPFLQNLFYGQSLRTMAVPPEREDNHIR